MSSIRRHLLQHRGVAALILLAALMMRVLVPVGFMPVIDHGAVTIILCPSAVPQVQTHGMEMPGSAHHSDGKHSGKSEAPCVFSGLSAPALSGADAVLLVAALLFAMMVATRTPDRRPFARAPRLRPPLRGPPVRS
ncbi:MAG: DUF2946 family protein [Novosphingobium sp.]